MSPRIPGNTLTKNFFDRTAAVLGLAALSPVIGVVAIAIKMKMPGGPVFFRQTRIGQYGKPFTMVKFRTMAASDDTNTVTTAKDPRVTPLGALLRKYKLDELPELWNVAKGDMSFVGPRPDVEGYADRLVGEQRNILALKPGITGPATLKYRNEEELLAKQEDPVRYNDEVIWPDKVRINMEYLANRTFTGDLRLIFRTLFGRRDP